jgi:hypothetical protein
MKKKAKAKKKKADGIAELLELLKTHRHLVHSLTLHPKAVKRMLKGRSARRLVASPSTRAALARVAGPEPGGSKAVCRKRTAHLCPKRTRCPYRTRSIADCGKQTAF